MGSIACAAKGRELRSPVIGHGGRLKAAGAHVPVKVVNASRGKYIRAEPISALHEQGRIPHAGSLPLLEDELCTWLPANSTSPDRLDALVWAMTELMIGGGVVSAPMRILHTSRRAPLQQRAG